MTNQKTNPKVEWGFYAITPRIVRTQYKDCSHAEKWLYTCLKDLCGDKGTCFRSLRALSEETGISIASLSTMIPHLHTVGLIHAEKKSRGRGGKEVWHISIVDIWQANKEYCSKNEQVPDGDVQELNNNVQNLNEVSESCSKNERSCSNFSDRRITLKNNITEERTIEEESNSDDTPKPPIVSSDTAPAFSLQDEKVFTDEKPQGDNQHGQLNTVCNFPGSVDYGHNSDHNSDDNPHQSSGNHIPVSGHQSIADSNQGQAASEQITGEHHANRVPALPAANTVAPGELAPSRHPQDHSDGVTLPVDGLLVVRPVGSATPEQQTNRDGGVVGGDTAHTLAETPPTSTQKEQTTKRADIVKDVCSVTPLSETCSVPASTRTAEYNPRLTPSQPGVNSRATHGTTDIFSQMSTKAETLPFPQAEQAALGQSPKGKGKKQAEPKPETPKGPPTEPPADMAWGTRKCLMWFDFWRGGILIGKFKLMQASTCAKGLAEQFDEQTVIQARTDMEADPYYAAKGGCDVCDVANNIHKYLKKRQSKIIAFKSKQQLIAQTEDLVEWQGRMMTVTEADALGFNGGFGAYL